MKKYLYKQIFDEDGNSAVIQSFIEDAVEYVENIFTDGTPEMEAYVYELGYREWWDEEPDEVECDGDCENCVLDNEESDSEDEFEEGKRLYDFIYDIVEEVLEDKFTR